MNKINQKLLRLPQVKATTGLSKSSIYARIAERRFPEQISTSIKCWIKMPLFLWKFATKQQKQD